MKTIGKFFPALFFCFCIVFIISSCRTSKSIINTGGSVSKKSQEQLIVDLLEGELKYKTISGKISLELIAGNKTSGMKVNSHLKIIKDNIIQLSIRAPFINMEVFRVNLTPDSIVIIDRLNKQYSAENFKKLTEQKKIQFNYNNLQSLLTNSLFIPGKTKVTKHNSDDYVITEAQDGGTYQLQTKDQLGIIYRFEVASNDRILQTNISGIKNNIYSLIWDYEDFIQDKEFVYPTKMRSHLKVDKKEINIVMSYSGLDIDKQLNVERELPSKYQQVSIKDILKNYIK